MTNYQTILFAFLSETALEIRRRGRRVEPAGGRTRARNVVAGPIFRPGQRSVRETRYIRSHTALRGIAALLVCVCHQVMFVCGADWMAGASRVLANGYAAVDLFFVRSGYIPTARYGLVFATEIERGAWRDFINRRFARLYPPHLATLAMALPFVLFRKNADLPAQEVIGDLTLNRLMVRSWGFRPEATFNFPSWSISVEWGGLPGLPAAGGAVSERTARAAGAAWTGLRLAGSGAGRASRRAGGSRRSSPRAARS
ncbi:acyltransferase family protein [Albimonas donghaensis]|uniref:acyltransferase family protein n=1 Tax=Albimonas donghaensis TaxID=356660 RepID=UPI0015A14A76|nr:acyltransferase [Albimonas donghaensis]